MPRLVDEANRDETLTRTFQVHKPNGGKMPVRVTFRPNRMTLEGTKETPGEADERSDGDRTNLRAAVNFCDYVESWDMVGPWSVDGVEVAGEGEMIPLEVPVIRSVAGWITTQLTDLMLEAVFPNLRELRRSQRR